VHAVEKVQRNGKIENCGPCGEAKCLLFQPIVILWPATKGRKDPQLKKRKKCNLLNQNILIFGDCPSQNMPMGHMVMQASATCNLVGRIYNLYSEV